MLYIKQNKFSREIQKCWSDSSRILIRSQVEVGAELQGRTMIEKSVFQQETCFHKKTDWEKLWLLSAKSSDVNPKEEQKKLFET